MSYVTIWKTDVVNGVAINLLVDLQQGNPVPSALLLAVDGILNTLLLATPSQTAYLTAVYKTSNPTRIAYNMTREAASQLNIDMTSLEVVNTEKLTAQQLRQSEAETYALGNMGDKDYARTVRAAQALTVPTHKPDRKL